jgi:flagellar motor protein MotB
MPASQNSNRGKAGDLSVVSDQLLKVLASELMKLPNKIAIEGHTDSTSYGRPDYSN